MNDNDRREIDHLRADIEHGDYGHFVATGVVLDLLNMFDRNLADPPTLVQVVTPLSWCVRHGWLVEGREVDRCFGRTLAECDLRPLVYVEKPS